MTTSTLAIKHCQNNSMLHPPIGYCSDFLFIRVYFSFAGEIVLWYCFFIDFFWFFIFFSSIFHNKAQIFRPKIADSVEFAMALTHVIALCVNFYSMYWPLIQNKNASHKSLTFSRIHSAIVWSLSSIDKPSEMKYKANKCFILFSLRQTQAFVIVISIDAIKLH